MFSASTPNSQISPAGTNGRSLEITESSTQDFYIVLVSIMSAFYQDPEILKYMMQTVRDRHDSDTPIVYICGDSVYRTTQHCLFAPEGRDPIEKGRTSWKKKYDKIIEEFRNKGKIICEMEVYWDTVKSDDSYAKIKNFIDIVFDSTLSIDGLKDQYPFVQHEGLLESLLNSVQSLNINYMVQIIASEFKAKNLGKLKKQERKENGKNKKIGLLTDLVHSELASLGIELKDDQKVRQAQDEEHNPLLEGTRAYLAEEFAVFMNLSLPADIASMGAKCGLDLSHLNEKTSVRPLMHYPISSTKGSNVIFETFQRVQSIYIEYCQLLGLPIITQPAAIIDLHVPENLRPARRSQLAQTSENQKLPSVPMPESKSVSVAELRSSLFYPVAEGNRDIQETAEKIIRMIDAHCKSVDIGIHKNTKLKYKNGIKCDIDVIKSVHTHVLELGSETRKIQRNDVKETIEQAVRSVKNDDATEIDIEIDYLGYVISLRMSVTQLSFDHASNTGHTSANRGI